MTVYVLQSETDFGDNIVDHTIICYYISLVEALECLNQYAKDESGIFKSVTKYNDDNYCGDTMIETVAQNHKVTRFWIEKVEMG
jgi:hypothetical protein